MPHITALHVYPVKSCRGIAFDRALVADAGFAHDREWLIVHPDGQFITQREAPRLALVETALSGDSLQLAAPSHGTLKVPIDHGGVAMEVVCWRDRCAAFDAGEEASRWLSDFLHAQVRLVRFDRRRKRFSNPEWTGDVQAPNLFSDGYPWLIASQASLDELNRRLEVPLPMNRFRPNIVIDGVSAFEEDSIHEFAMDEVRLRAVKPCTRCAITTTNQATGEREGDEPLRTLGKFRHDRTLKGVTFGQNVVLIAGLGRELHVGQPVTVVRRTH